jgi:hypothetical protein
LSNYNSSLRELYNAFPDQFQEIKDLLEDEDLEMRLRNDGIYTIQQTRLIDKVCFLNVNIFKSISFVDE